MIKTKTKTAAMQNCLRCAEEIRKADRSRKYAHELKNIFITISTVVNAEIESPHQYSSISNNTSMLVESGDASPFIMEGRKQRNQSKTNSSINVNNNANINKNVITKKNNENKIESNTVKSIAMNYNKPTNKNEMNNLKDKDSKNENKIVKNIVSNINKNNNKKNNENELGKSDFKNIDIKRAESFTKSKDMNHNKMDMKSFIKSINKNISENENKVFEKSFDRLANLQTLLKKESSLKELCKFYLF